MAFTFPLSTAQFMALINIKSVRFWLPESRTFESSEGGEVFTAERGPRLWQAEFSLAPGDHQTVDECEARLSLLAQSGASFMAYDPRRTGPRYDPTGSGLTGYSPVIGAATTARDLRITGLPNGYGIVRGDYIGFAYGSSPVRYALHRAVSNWSASGGSATVEVVPPLRPGWATGAAVSFVRPTCKMVVLPGYSSGVGEGIATSGATFRAQQTLR